MCGEFYDGRPFIEEVEICHEPEQPPYRPPSEAHSVLVRVTRGCAWNRCSFCGMYKRLRFEIRKPDDIERDLLSLRAFYPKARSIFLADSDSLTHPKLPTVVESIRRIFPEAERITSYARLTTLRRLKPGRLRALREAGLTRIHAGLESGSEPILLRVRKGVRPEQAIEGGRRAIEAGFELSLYVLSGLGGEDCWEDHATESARVVRETWPHFLRLRSLVLLPGTPLSDEQQAGTFRPASPLTRLREIRLLTEHLSHQKTSRDLAPSSHQASSRRRAGACHGEDCPPALREGEMRDDEIRNDEIGDGEIRGGEIRNDEIRGGEISEIEIASDHFSNMVWADREIIYGGINGFLPADRQMLLRILDAAIEKAKTGQRVIDPGTIALRGKQFSLYGPAL
ncbi:MAG: radical SAM protein [Candidatus Eisenbacteria sp.]|nr:radical SAM protein [Candidatus Eisenbacteria bacterium]